MHVRKLMRIVVRVLGVVVALSLVTVATTVIAEQSQNGDAMQIPRGAIVGFARDTCPVGWERYSEAEGRFLIGAYREIPRGQVGGSSDHSHSGTTGPGGDARGVDNDNDHWPSANEHRHNFTTKSSLHIPPYVAVLFCLKT